MTIATLQRMSLEEFLAYDDGTDTRYELVDGVLVEMGAESTPNNWIAMFLTYVFAGLGLPYYRVGTKQKIEVKSDYVTAREPDLILHSEGSALAMKGRKQAILKLRESNPIIVVEVASPGDEKSENYERDYKYKPAEYAARGIPEYWIVDPDRAVVQVGILTGGAYQFQAFTDSQPIKSPAFPALVLTAAQVLTAGE
jgi:Uma2 family endonuclease